MEKKEETSQASPIEIDDDDEDDENSKGSGSKKAEPMDEDELPDLATSTIKKEVKKEEDGEKQKKTGREHLFLGFVLMKLKVVQKHFL